MANPLTPAASDRVCRHIYKDRVEAIILYGQVFAEQSEVASACLTNIDSTGMDLIAEVQGESKR